MEKPKEEKKFIQKMKYRHAFQSRPSMIEEAPNPRTISTGARNLGMVLLILVFVEKIVSNVEKGEPMVDLHLLFHLTSGLISVLFITFIMTVWCFNIFFIEKLLIKEVISEKIAYIVYSISQIILFSVPTYFALTWNLSIVSRGSVSLQMAVYLMKTHSFFFTNRKRIKKKMNNEPEKKKNEEKKETKEEEAKSTKYKYEPSKNTVQHFTLFLLYPTLVYEQEYPRTKKRSWKSIAKYLSLMIGSFFLLYLNINYFMIPAFKEALEKNFIRIMIKLAVPSVLSWLLLFFGVFHCLLNLIAEFFMFADRKFYSDWWNAKTFDEFWNKWNTLVYEWFHRHIYLDSMTDMNIPRPLAMVLVFLVSALWHEFIISTSFLFFRPYMAASMMGQFSVIYFTKIPFIRDSGLGNIVLWLCLTVGQSIVYIGYSLFYFSKFPIQN
ncbi:sterol o-acyltransferase [Anaeramoeba ignava]|uniref:O-acyltransferase n=1 Tax=Anaeramoeba ignava TaxID=1746090 RepID=A0A9Q0L599_ANAIG|nr:sterol o-acyltransferase [Anaeramoeba ignava]